MIDDDFVSNLPAEPFSAVKAVVEKYEGMVEGCSIQEFREMERAAIQLLAISTVILKKHSINIGVNAPNIGHDVADNFGILNVYFQALSQTIQRLDTQNFYFASVARYESELDVGFQYEFSEGEIERLQSLINELREAIGVAEYLDEDHRRRLLGRLEKLQGELHKRVSDLDVFLGVVVQIGAVGKRAGEDAKPLVDRAREIGEIVAGVFRRAEKLPPGPEFPLLPKSDDSDD